jgi:hypothetical protein
MFTQRSGEKDKKMRFGMFRDVTNSGVSVVVYDDPDK